METIKVDQKFIKKIVKNSNLESFHKDKAKSFEHEGQKYVFTWAVGDGKGVGWRVVICRRAILPENYTGTVEPMRDFEHSVAVDKGLRERGYHARLVDINGAPHVLTDEVEFVPE